MQTHVTHKTIILITGKKDGGLKESSDPESAVSTGPNRARRVRG